MAAIIDGKTISTQIKDELKQKAAELHARGIEVTLAVIQVGDNPASSVYVRTRKRDASISESVHYPMSFRKKRRRKSF